MSHYIYPYKNSNEFNPCDYFRFKPQNFYCPEKDCSAYFPAGTTQFYINNDISYSYVQYYLATEDMDFIKAYDYFIKTARLDLDDIRGNTKDGVHTANMEGTWMAMFYGFAGLRIKEDYIILNPRLPEKWKELKFKFLYKGACIKVDMQKEKTIIDVQCDNSINLKINNQLYELTGNKEIKTTLITS